MNKENLKQLSKSLETQFNSLPKTVLSSMPVEKRNKMLSTLSALNAEIDKIKDIPKPKKKSTSTKKKSTSSK